jgi:raffinose/stachyose/melibiose transport system substrate-binding protein
MKKKLLLLMLCVVMVASSFAGCSKRAPQKDKASATQDGSSEASKNKKDGEVVKLRMMAYNAESSRATYLKYLAEQLEGIEIEFEFVSTDNFDNVLNAQLQAGEGPDIIEVGGQTKLLASAGYLLDLTEQFFVSNYVEPGILPYTVESKVYATPLQSWYEGIFYNRQIFADNGISVPKTWDEFIQIHKTLAEKGIKAQTMGAQSYEPMMKQSIALVNNMFYSTNASKDYDEKYNNGEVSLAHEWLPAVQEWYKIIEEGCLTEDMLGLSYDQALDEFATGNAAMWESGPWAVSTIMEKNPDLDLGMFPIPGPEADKAGWLVGGPGSAFAINAKSEHIEEALKVLEITATAEAQQALVKDNAGSSFVKGVEVDLGDTYVDCEEAFKEGHVYAPWTAVWINGNAITTGYGKSLQEVLAGSKTVEEALTDADRINDDLRATMQ